MDRITIQASKELLAIPGVRNFGAHIGQALIMDEVVRHVLRRKLDQRRSISVDYDETLNKIQEASTAIRASIATCRPISRSASARCSPARTEAITVRIYGHDLDVLRAQGRRSAKSTWKRSKASSDLKVADAAERIPQINVKVNLAKAHRTWHQAGRRAPRDRDARRRRRSRRHPYRQPHLRRQRLEHARIAQQPDQHSEPADRHAERQDGAAGRQSPMSPSRRRRTSSSTRTSCAASTSAANVKGRDLGSVRRRVERPSQTVEFPAGVSIRRSSANITERQTAAKQVRIDVHRLD